MQLSSTTTVAPLPWEPRAQRGAHQLPTDHAVDVASAGVRFSPRARDPRYQFGSGIAQAVRGVEIFVEHGGSVPAAQVLEDVRRAVAEVPQPMLDRLKRVLVLARQDDGYDRFYAQTYKLPGFQAVAAGGGGIVSFFGGKPYTQSVLYHELGHNLPVDIPAWRAAVERDDATIAALAKRGTLSPVEFEPVPDPVRRERWTPRLAPGAITPYGAMFLGEDISEGVRLLMAESHFGHAFATIRHADGSTTPLSFGEAYPARTAVLEHAAQADLDHDGVIGA